MLQGLKGQFEISSLLALVALVTLLVTITTTGALMVKVGRDESEKANIEQWNQQTQAVSRIAASYVQQYDYAAVTDLVEALLLQDDILGIEVIEDDDTRIVSVGLTQGSAGIAVHRAQTGETSVSIFVDKSAMAVTKSDALGYVFVILILGTGIPTSVLFLVSRKLLVNPLRRMETAVRSVETEDWQFLSEDNGREIVRLSTGINRMAFRIQQRTKALETANTVLKRQVLVIENTQKALVQSQKLEAVGQLTGGLAHDFNNLLAIILGCLEMEKETESEKRKDASENITQAIEASNRAAALTKQLLMFSRQAPLSATRVNMNDVLLKLEPLLKRTIPENIEVEIFAGTDHADAVVDKVQLESAVLNLAVNARDAMPNGGRLTISSSDYVTREPRMFAGGVELIPGEYVVISVCDSGTGIPEDVLERIFDPFFTTKAVGKGSGLGLSMVFGYVKQSNGSAEVISQVGAGTEFRLYFPKAEPVSSADPVQRNIPLTPKSLRRWRVLLVEDEPVLGRIVEKILLRLNCKVDLFFDGDSALEIMDQGTIYDLVISDVVMPGTIQGTELAFHAERLQPQAKIVLMSGYMEPERSKDIAQHKNIVFAAKPVRLDFFRNLLAHLEAERSEFATLM